MDAETIRKINLLDCLLDDHPGMDAPPDNAVSDWSEQQLRDHFTAATRIARSEPQNGQCGPHDGFISHSIGKAAGSATSSAAPSRARADSNENRSTDRSNQPGGGVQQVSRGDLDPASAPPLLRTHQLASTVAGYRSAAVADGIPFRCCCPRPELSYLISHLGRALAECQTGEGRAMPTESRNMNPLQFAAGRTDCFRRMTRSCSSWGVSLAADRSRSTWRALTARTSSCLTADGPPATLRRGPASTCACSGW